MKPPKSFNSFWTIKDIFYLILFFYSFQFIVGLFYRVINEDIKNVLYTLFLSALIIIWTKKVKKDNLAICGLKKASSVRFYMLALVLGIFLGIATFAINPNNFRIIIAYSFKLSYVKVITYSFLCTYRGLTAAFLSPLCEELFFRGVVFQVIRKKFGIITSIMLVSFVFSLAHYANQLLAYKILLASFVYSLFLTWLFERSRSLFPSLVCHAIINILIYTMNAIILISK